MITIAVHIAIVLWLFGAIVTSTCLGIVLDLGTSPIAALDQRNSRRYVVTMPIAWPRRLPRLMRAARSHIAQGRHQ